MSFCGSCSRHTNSIREQRAVSRLLAQDVTVYFCARNVTEFWHVATRPVSANGLGFSRDEVVREIESIERLLTLLPDTPALYEEWKRIVSDHSVQGAKVYDARPVVLARVHGVTRILIFTPSDFRRYGMIEVLEPLSVPS
jgi:predicted nucleic acid-binding protein